MASMRIRSMASGGAVAGALLVAAAACTNSPLQDGTAVSNEAGEELAAENLKVYEKFASMEEPERTEALIDAAQEEGSVSLYGSGSMGNYADAFTEKYGIETSVYDPSSTDEAMSRLLQEASAGKYVADVFDSGSMFLDELEEDELLGRYESEHRNVVPDDVQGEYWTALRRQPFVVAYNTDEIDPSDIPEDFLDLADQEWDGKISMSFDDYDWYQGMVQYYQSRGMSREEIDAKFEAIAGNSVVVRSHPDQADLLAAGQFGITTSSYVHHIERLSDDGAPVTWGGGDEPTVQPIIMRYQGIALTRHAPHPAAATLFMDFILGPEGRQILLDERYLPAVPSEDDPLAGLNVVLLDLDEYAEHNADWATDYDAMLRNAEH